jgi:hypothetical protein
VPALKVQLVKLSEGHRADRAGPGGGPVDRPVMDADQVTVLGQPDITLDPIGPLLDGEGVSAKGVLGSVGGCTTMCDNVRLHTPILT